MPTTTAYCSRIIFFLDSSRISKVARLSYFIWRFMERRLERLTSVAKWKHGQNERIEQRMVPMQVWASNRFIAKYPGKFAALASRTTPPLSHDHFFHSVLDCIGIQSQAVDRRLSLCTQGKLTERTQSIPTDDLGPTSQLPGNMPNSTKAAVRAAIAPHETADIPIFELGPATGPF